MRVHLRDRAEAACGFSIHARTLTDVADEVTCGHCRKILAKAKRPPPETEAGFQGWVTDLADLMGWRWYHTHDSRRSPEGFPDLVLVRGGRIIFAELKREDGGVTTGQSEWLVALARVAVAAGHLAPTGEKVVSVGVWRPSDRSRIEYELAREPRRA